MLERAAGADEGGDGEAAAERDERFFADASVDFLRGGLFEEVAVGSECC